MGDTDTVLEKAQALVGAGYTVTVKAADGTAISAAGVATAAGAGTISFTVTETATPTNTFDTATLNITVNPSVNAGAQTEAATGVTAASASMTQAGITEVSATATTWSAQVATGGPAVFQDVTNKLKGYNIILVDGGASATATTAALVGTTFTVTLPTAGAIGNHVRDALKAATGVVSGSDVEIGLAAFDIPSGGIVKTISPGARVDRTDGTEAVIAQEATADFKVTTGATKSGKVSVKITEDDNGTKTDYTASVDVVADDSAAIVATKIAAGTYTSAPFVVTSTGGDTVTITQTTGKTGVTYTVTVQ